MWSLCLALASAAGASLQADSDPIFLPARAALEVLPDEKGEIGVGELLARFEAIGDWTIATDEATRALLERTRFVATGPLRAEPEAVTRTVGAVLASFRCRWTVELMGPRTLWGESLETSARESDRGYARFVTVGEIAPYEHHPAVFVHTQVPLAALDAREMSNALRGLIVDPSACSIVPTDDASGLLVSGSGRQVANLVALLEDADRLARGEALPAKHPIAPVSAEGEVVIEAGERRPTMLDLVRTYAERAGRTALLDFATVELLTRTPIGLTHPLTVAGAELPTLFEELLHANKFALYELVPGRAPGSRALFTVRSLDLSARRMMAQSDVRYVDARALPDAAAHPATMFTALVHLPHVDVRALSNASRAMVVDPSFQQIAPVEAANALLLLGFGRELARLQEAFGVVEAAAAARPAAEIPPERGK